MKIEKERKKIDEIDHKILKLIAERLTICKNIGDIKKKGNIEIEQREREKFVITDRINFLRKEKYHDEEFVKKLFQIIMEKSRNEQNKCYE